MKFKKIIWLIGGCISLVFVGIGVVVPMIPYFPFLMLSACCFAKSSEKLHQWITNTDLYKQNIDSFVKGKGMTVGAKIKVMTMATMMMAGGFIVMYTKGIFFPCYVLAGVWIMHMFIFIFRIKTYKPE